MSENSKNKGKKSFYLTLYSAAACMVFLAAIISIYNIKTANKGSDKLASESVQEENLPVNAGKDKSYLEKTSEGTTAIVTQTTTSKPEAIKKSEQNEKPKEKETTENKNAENEIFSLFDESKEMSWPLSGQIIMDYSVETAIYDKTLDQYRTNDSIYIKADENAEVKAACEGVVESIFVDNVKGQSVVLNHGNGWRTTYSQLNANLSVKEGEVVCEGEVLGFVAPPTNYSIASGTHLEFMVSKDNVTEDPKLILAQVE